MGGADTLKKKTIIQQRKLKSKTGKSRKGMFKFTQEKIIFSTGSDEDSEAVTAAFDTMSSGYKPKKDHIIEYISNMEDFAKRVIRKVGLDPDDGAKIYESENGRRLNYFAAIAERKEKREPEGYAGDILEHAKCLKAAIKNEDLFGALFEAIKMEDAYGDFNLSQYELEILIGSERMSDGKKAIKYAPEQKDDWREEAHTLKSNNQNLSLRDIALRVVKNNSNLDNKSFDSVYRHLLNNKNNNEES